LFRDRSIYSALCKLIFSRKVYEKQSIDGAKWRNTLLDRTQVTIHH